MASEAIPFNMTQASGLEELAGASPAMVNALVDSTGTIRQRPGISAWSEFPDVIPNEADVTGMIPFGESLMYMTDDKYLWSVTYGGLGSVSALSSSTTTTQVDGSLRPIMVAMRDKVIIAAGGEPQKWTGSGYSGRLGGSPPQATHVVGIATRALLSVADDRGRFQFSDPGDSGHETWDALNVTEAEARPDKLMALHDNTNEVYAFGSQTLQLYQPDEILGFATGRAVNVGLLAPYSVVSVDGQMAFLERERRFVLADGRQFSDSDIISQPIDATIRALDTVTDTWGFRMKIAPFDAAVWMLPTAGKGFMWQREANRWSEWRGYSDGNWAEPEITSSVYWPEKNLLLVGLATGQIAKLDTDAYTDLGATLKVQLRTGFVNRSTEDHKHCESVRFVFRRGESAATEPVVTLSWRDDLGEFCSPVRLSLGVAGDYVVSQPVRSLGTYRRRQWQIEFSDDAEFVFIEAIETFNVGEDD